MAQDLGLHKPAGKRGEQKGRTEERKRAGSRSFSPDEPSPPLGGGGGGGGGGSFDHIKQEDDGQGEALHDESQHPAEAAEERERKSTF